MNNRILLTAVLLALVPTQISLSASKGIFRHVNLNEGRKVRLGKSLRQTDVIAQQIAPNTYELRPQFFIDATAIMVYTAENDKVQCIRFEYHTALEFSAKVASYIHMLGSPSTEVQSQATVDKSVGWVDKKTSFALFPARDGVAPYSVLLDKKLCAAWDRRSCACE